MPESLVSLLYWVIPAIVVALGLLFLATRFIVNVGALEIAIKERRYIGKEMPPGRVLATRGEVGVQADVLKAGWHFLKWPLETIYARVPLVEIGPDELGVVEAIDGQPLPAGTVFATDPTNDAHNNFQDPVKFLEQGGFKGIQLRTLPPGKWPIHPVLFKVSIAPMTRIAMGKVGIVTSVDGKPLSPGRLHGDKVEGHHSFSDAEAFIKNGGQKGPQVEILKPGTYRIHRESQPLNPAKGEGAKAGLFKIEEVPATVVDNDKIGIVEALDGAPLDPKDYVAPSVPDHDNFQDCSAFLQRGGKRGPQKDILLPGVYQINTSFFKVTFADAGVVNPGEVAVIVSNVGKDPTEEVRKQMAEKVRARMESEEAAQAKAAAQAIDKVDGKDKPVAEIEQELLKGDPADSRLDKGAHEAYVVPEGYRGIQEKVVGPGKYYVNTKAVTPVIVPTTNQTVEWTADDKTMERGFNPFEVISQDGFKMNLEVRVVFRVKPEDAPFMVAKIGSLKQLVDNVMHPLIDSIFRNQASKSPAIKYMQDRTVEQEAAEALVRKYLLKYHVDVVNVLICHIRLPEDLMKTHTDRVLAEQRKAMFERQGEAEVKRIEFEKKKSEADNQAKLMEATVGVEIASKKADQRKKEAEGEAYFTEQTGRAEAAKLTAIGEAQGVAYQKQVEALGQTGVALVQVINAIAEKGLRITPDIVAGGSGDGSGNLGALVTALLAKQLAEGARKPEAAATSEQK